ncbi:hypothetical protein DPMN_097779 [Dreissena polymorpha]|uniref:Reverse transcriptase/retrotransposon-derived protein RNase H-like domain-containing protein n=1 Tax=Dreissena polymorpha TaxID=45954 RepID=A0A9D4LAW5_DREPO|nr:hypothetical protein DPMN_097779 [Dreissena polymorpha]
MVELTKKDVACKWHDDCQRSFEDLKKILISQNIMAYPLQVGEFCLDVDASDVGIGAVLH